MELTLNDGLDMVVLRPGAELLENAHDNSVVVRLTFGQVPVLLPGDIEAVVEQQLVGNGGLLESTVLKAAHHGSCSSTTSEFLETVNPEMVAISVGPDNRFGHPCDEVLEQLGARAEHSRSGLQIYRTDEHGAVEAVSDRAQVRVEAQRGD